MTTVVTDCYILADRYQQQRGHRGVRAGTTARSSCPSADVHTIQQQSRPWLLQVFWKAIFHFPLWFCSRLSWVYRAAGKRDELMLLNASTFNFNSKNRHKHGNITSIKRYQICKY